MRPKESLIAQKPLVQAYVIDQVRDKMIGTKPPSVLSIPKRGYFYPA